MCSRTTANKRMNEIKKNIFYMNIEQLYVYCVQCMGKMSNMSLYIMIMCLYFRCAQLRLQIYTQFYQF